MKERESLNDAPDPPRDPRVPFCEGGSATCEICVGSCGIDEYEDHQDAWFKSQEEE